MQKYILPIIIFITLVAGSIFLIRQLPDRESDSGVEAPSITEELADIFDVPGPKEPGILSESDLSQGCPRRDCIASLDDPNFESQEDADKWLNDDDLVFGIVIDGEARAYPQRILNWHEIVNDTIQGQDIAVTFCPLCGSAISFERKVDGVTTTFGVSGKLYNSNLVMYDRLEDSYWQQETGIAILGEAAQREEKLKPIPMASVFWEDWRENHPETLVLSRDTGFVRDYARYPYGSYEEDGDLYFGIENTDNRLPLKAPGFGFSLSDGNKFYQTKDIPEGVEVNDTIGNQDVVVQNQKGIVTLTTEAGEEIVPIRTFWFAFAAFHPDAEIYQAD